MKKILLTICLVLLMGAGCVDQSSSYSYTPSPSLVDSVESEPIQVEPQVIRENIRPSPPPSFKQTCCKYCSKGKACGDSCISRSYTCHKGPGCACDT